MKILVVGSGGREHAIVWKLAQSNRVDKIICAPGSDAIAAMADCRDVGAEDLDGLVNLAKTEGIDLTIIGPEAPLCMGLTDLLQKEGIKVFGPSKNAAELEGSKVACKDFMARHGIPTADYVIFQNPEHARHYLQVHTDPVVIKADGLAAGKGVFVCENQEEALKAVESIMEERKFGSAGNKIVIEEKLIGEEASFIVATDGENIIPLVTSQDHKAAFDGDNGPNTGGMGAYSPAPAIDQNLHDQIMETIIEPTIHWLKIEGRPFVGFLYAGLMITPEGPKVLEFNVRLGDPETQPLMMRLNSDLAELAEAGAEGKLDRIRLDWDQRASVCVVMAAAGYPGNYPKGQKIKGLKDAGQIEDVVIFHSGTKIDGEKWLTSGGRVLGVTALGENIQEAIDRAYQAVELISWNDVHFRNDIGLKALERPQVGIIMGSDSDWPVLSACSDKLSDLGLFHEVRVLSAHRTPEEAGLYAKAARCRGIKVIIAAAGGAAHLAGAMAGQTTLPVIGVPVTATPLNGLDALLATVQMPPGVPVATVALDKWGAINAAILAAQIIGTSNAKIAKRLADEKTSMAKKVREKESALLDSIEEGEK